MVKTFSTTTTTPATTRPKARTIDKWKQLSQAWSHEFKAVDSSSSSNAIASALQRTMPLLDDPQAVPFVCRYRTDVIAPLTTSQIHQLSDMLQTHQSLEALRTRILKQIGEIHPDLLHRIQTSLSKSELEDLYAPFKPPSKGSLEDRIRKDHPELVDNVDALWTSLTTTSSDGKTTTTKEVVQDHRHLLPRDAAITLLANKISSHTTTCEALLEYVERHAKLQTSPILVAKTSKSTTSATKTKQTTDSQKYSTYHEFTSSFHHVRDYQVLAIRRGVDQKALKISYEMDGDRAESRIRRALHEAGIFPTNGNAIKGPMLWNDAVHNAWSRLLRKRMTSRLWKDKCSQAEERSIHVFCDNLLKALLAPPLARPRPILALDPGFQAGIKCATLDMNGQLLHETKGLVSVKFLQNRQEGVQHLCTLLQTVQRAAENSNSERVTVALGNGHGSQEARELVKEASQSCNVPIDIQLVSEAGASVWSVTEGANREFPTELPAAVAAVSIGRRYQNPLPELVKIPPRSLGLGMYQHDLSKKDLDEKLHLTSVHAVAEVGVDGNACSLEILEKIPGLTQKICKRILKARPLQTRNDLLVKVTGLGPKTFENCAAFIRIEGGKEPLDSTLVHPESYELARYLLKQLKWDLKDQASLRKSELPKSKDAQQEQWGDIMTAAVSKFDVSLDRVASVIHHLIVSMTNPDPRFGGNLSIVDSSSVTGSQESTIGISNKVGSTKGCSMLPSHLSTSMDHLKKACPLRSITAAVRNVVDFGAFVDFGGENDALLHRSKLGRVALASLLVGQEIGVDILSVSDSGRVSVGLAGLNLSPDPLQSSKPKNSASIGKRSYSTVTERVKGGNSERPSTMTKSKGSKGKRSFSRTNAYGQPAKRRRIEKK